MKRFAWILLASLVFSAGGAFAAGACTAFCDERLKSCLQDCDPESESRTCRSQCALQHEECLMHCKNPNPTSSNEVDRSPDRFVRSDVSQGHPAFSRLASAH